MQTPQLSGLIYPSISNISGLMRYLPSMDKLEGASSKDHFSTNPFTL